MPLLQYLDTSSINVRVDEWPMYVTKYLKFLLKETCFDLSYSLYLLIK